MEATEGPWRESPAIDRLRPYELAYRALGLFVLHIGNEANPRETSVIGFRRRYSATLHGTDAPDMQS
jgi:hypothetical protein